MSLGKRLFIGGAAAAAPSGTSDTLDVFGDGNCIALYTLDYDASETGGNYDGTLWGDVDFGVDGQMNWGASFNDGYIQTSLSIGNTTDFTMSFWVKDVTQSNFGSYQYKSILQDYNGNYLGLLYDKSIGKIVLIVHDGSTQLGIVKTSVLDDDWHHIVFTQDVNLETKVYVDGSLQTSETLSHTSMTQRRAINAGTGLYIAANPANITSDLRYRGKLDQVRIFNKAVSQNEVDTLYAETACVYTPTTDTLDYQGTNIAYYKLDGNANDETTNYDGAESNITYEFGRYGTAAVFNGSSSKIEFTPDSNFVNDFTISAWINMNQLPVSGYLYQVVAWGDEATGERRSLGIWNGGSGDPKVYFSGYGASANFGGNTSVSANQWYHICVTRSGSTVKVYLNGNPDGTGTVTLNYYTGTTGRIGASGSAQEFFNGSIDQVRIFGSALDDTAVENLYNEKQAYITKDASDPFGDNSEEAFYKLENNANDSTGSNNGTWSGTPAYITGVFGQGADFNGTNRIDTGITSNYSNYTISVWAKKDAGGEKYIIQKGSYVSSSNNNFTLIGHNSSGNLFVYNRLNTTTNQNISTIIPNTGEWFHLVVTKDSSNVNTIYYNGVKQTTSSPSPANSSSDEWQIGGGNLSGAWDGGVDQVRIFDRALDGDEVFKLYAEHIN